MACYLNSRQLFVMLVCLQSSAFFAGAAFVVHVAPVPGTSKVDISFPSRPSVQVEKRQVIKNYYRFNPKSLPDFYDGTMCFGVAADDVGGDDNVDNGIGYLMAFNRCGITLCGGIIKSGSIHTLSDNGMTCDFLFNDCDAAEGFKLLECPGIQR